MTVIGLTGGIASGKSTAAALLKELGAVVIDADRLGHRVYEPGTRGFQAVVNEFGHDLVQADGTINRQLLGGKVFGDPTQMERLTSIVWPEIRRLGAQEIAEARRRDRRGVIVLEAAVMIEAGWTDLVDEVWVVTVPPEVAKDRLISRSALSEAQAKARIDSQISNRERLLHADVKIENSGGVEQLEQRVLREWRRLQRLNEPPRPAAKAVRTPAKAAKVVSKASAKITAKAAVKQPMKTVVKSSSRAPTKTRRVVAGRRRAGAR